MQTPEDLPQQTIITREMPIKLAQKQRLYRWWKALCVRAFIGDLPPEEFQLEIEKDHLKVPSEGDVKKMERRSARVFEEACKQAQELHGASEEESASNEHDGDQGAPEGTPS